MRNSMEVGEEDDSTHKNSQSEHQLLIFENLIKSKQWKINQPTI